MTTTWLLVSFLILPLPGPECSGSLQSPAWAAQPPEPDQPTPPAAPTPAPGEPTEPPVLEDEPTTEPDPGMPTPDPSAPCCFDHPRYSGNCSVTPHADETCASILAYLNDPMSVGKTYCNYTDLRGGWKPAQCTGR